MDIITLPPRKTSAIAAAFCTVALGGVAHAQLAGVSSVLPATGTDTRVGDLRQQVESLLGMAAPSVNGPAWQFYPSIGIDVGATDNALETNSPRRADIFTMISPTLTVTGDTARLKVNASYSPLATIFARTSTRTRFDQYLGGDALATVVPDLFYVDVRANITQSSITGGYAPYGSLGLNGQNQVQTSSVAVTPSLVHRFGGWGTGTLAYTLAYTTQSGYGAGNAYGSPFGVGPAGIPVGGNPLLGAYTNYGGDQSLTTNRELARFTTGENLGRINLTFAADLEQFGGSGVYSNASRDLYTVDSAYALNRSIALLASLGYEDLRYSGNPGLRISGPVWRAGVRWTPNPDSSVTVEYGRQSGVESLFVDGSYAPTARTRIYASYSTGITSANQQAQNLLTSASFGPGGLATNSITGAPLVNTGAIFGTQNALYRLHRLSLTGVLLRPRDTYSITVTNEDQQVLSGTGTTATNGSYGGTYGQISWQHDLSPVVSSNVYLQYGTFTPQFNGIGGNTTGAQFATANAGLNYIMTPTLSSHVNYIVSSRFGGGAGTGYLENIFLVGIRKGF